MRRRAALVAAATLLVGCAEGPSGPTPGSPTFDGNRAMELVRTQVGFGPRIPGSEGHARQLVWMLDRLDSVAPALVADTFQHVTQAGDTLALVNVLASFQPERTRRILLLTHWDTRPRSDQARDSAAAERPVPGANDGGSGTAILLEIASLFDRVPPPMGVDLLFVDGEDYGPGTEDMFLGTRRYADALSDDRKPVYGLLLDMVGDADPSFPPEAYSEQYAGVVVRKLWRAAERLGYRGYFPSTAGPRINDDHIPLIEAGLPTADLIDFSYPYWHTPEDLPEHVSAATLGMVGQVVIELIYSGG